MKSQDPIEKHISEFVLGGTEAADERNVNDALAAYERSKTKPTAGYRPLLWRMIMNRPIMKLAAAAAVIVLIGVAGIHLLNHSVTPAYAIEQTIDALKEARIIYMLCTGWDGKEIEMWTSLNDKGYPEYCYSYMPDYEVTNISTPTVSYQYNAKMNRVSINQGKLYHFDIQFEKIFEHIQEAVRKKSDSVKIYRQADASRGKTFIVAVTQGDTQNFKIFIDPETKLPVSIYCLKGRNRPGDFIRDFKEIRFDEELPEGIFEFEIPEGADVVDMDYRMQLLDDVNNGISAEGLTKQEAAEAIVREYWPYIIEKDLENTQKTYPSISMYSAEEARKRYDKCFGESSWPVEFLEVGKLYVENSCGLGEILPCILMFEDGRKREVKLIIRFRNIEGKSSCVIAGYFGYPVEID